MSIDYPRAISSDEAVCAAFDAYPEDTRRALLRLRSLILETAAETTGVGRIDEVLKWGQPSYLTSETRSGSTVRIGTAKDDDRTVAVFFHCQTDLVATFRGLYPDCFAFDGNRAIYLAIQKDIPSTELKHCISLALTYHSRKKTER